MRWQKTFTLLLMLLAVPAGAAETRQVPQSREQLSLSYAPVVRKAAPAVVNIYTKTRVQVRDSASPLMSDPFFQQFFGREFAFRGRTREQVASSLGSGVIVSPDGLIVTSNHVVKEAEAIIVVLADRREFEAEVKTRDLQSDLAILQIKAPASLPYLDMRNSDTLEVGDLVLAIGNPFGVGQTVTSGIISALARKAGGVSDYQFFIQTDAAINPGNSGGALVDMEGKLIGVNTAIYSNSGGSLGIGFAIPANMVRAVMESSMGGGKLVRPWLGIAVQPVTSEVAESMGLPAPQGVIVRSIYPDSTAATSGVRVGDIILSLNGNEVSTEQEFRYRIALARVGETGEIEILRNGKRQRLPIEMTEAPEIPPRDERVLEGRQPLMGVKVANLSPALAVEMHMGDTTAEGVIVVEAGDNRLAGNLSMQPGDIILEINDSKVTSTGQLESLLAKEQKNWKIVYQRGNNVLTLKVRM